MLKEFKEFALKGNVLDLAIAVVMGAAFNKIVTSLVQYIIMPLIGKLFGSVNFAEDWSFWGIKYGLFIQSIIDFIIIAFALFIFVKIANTVMKKEEKEEEVEENTVLSGRNIPGVEFVETTGLNVLDILGSNKVVFTKDAVEKVGEVLA